MSEKKERRGKAKKIKEEEKKEKQEVRLTNRQFAEKNKELKEACKAVRMRLGIEVKLTARQASKWRRQTGLAYKEGR